MTALAKEIIFNCLFLGCKPGEYTYFWNGIYRCGLCKQGFYSTTGFALNCTQYPPNQSTSSEETTSAANCTFCEKQ